VLKRESAEAYSIVGGTGTRQGDGIVSVKGVEGDRKAIFPPTPKLTISSTNLKTFFQEANDD